MASKGQNNEQRDERVVPNVAAGKSSRVSKAAGSIGSSSVHIEQRSSPSHSRQPSGTNKRAGSSANSGKPSAKKGRTASASPVRKSPASATPMTADSHLISRVRDRWGEMQPHEQQRLFSVALLVMSLLLLFAISFWRNAPLFKPLADFFFNMFSWATFPLVLGLIAFAIAHLVEGIRNIRFIRWSLVVGLLALVLLLLVESQLLASHSTGGIVGGLLSLPIVGLGFAGHILVLGLFIVVMLVTFRIKISDIRNVAVWMYEAFVAPRRSGSVSATSSTVSPFLGQRPLYSRFTNGTTDANEPSKNASRKQITEEDENEEDESIEFEDDFDPVKQEDDDPRNNINIHKDQVGLVPKGRRVPSALDRSEHLAAVKGVRQQQLPLQHANASDIAELEEMEPLMPNPQAKQQVQPKVVRRPANASGTAPEIESPWKQPDTNILNSPENSKLQILGDDTTTLARTIQNTLRSFRVEAEVRPEDISIGPTVIRFGIRPTGKPMLKEDGITPVKDASGNIVYEVRTRVSRIMALQNDLALVLESKTIRMEAPVPGRPYVGVEIPNKNSRMVTLREILESKEYQAAKSKSRLTVALGRDVAGMVRVGDLSKMPHLLIAGATGAGKCLAYDEPIFLADGHRVPVQELVGQSTHVIGVTDTRTMHQLPALATFTENGVREVFDITLDNGLVLRRTGEHPLWSASLSDGQYVGRQSDGRTMRETRATSAGWIKASDLRTRNDGVQSGGHVILCALRDRPEITAHREGREGALWRNARPVSDQNFADCPFGYEWREIVSIGRSVAPTVTIEVHNENHAFVGSAVEHNSVMINAIISSVITQASPEDVRMLMVDPKMVELSMYNGIPHLLSPVVIEVEKVVGLLKLAIAEMEKRYRLFSQLGVRNLDGYRRLRGERILAGDETLKNLPAIVIIIDELADLMMAAPDEVEGLICRLAQLARATGIHLVVATQRPSVDVITGLIKANIPTRISFMVSSAVDSRTIIDMGGAERLLGRGDMLYLPADAGKPERIQGAFVADEEAERLVEYWKKQAIEHSAESSGEPSVNGPLPATPGVEPGWEIKEHASDEFELEDDLLEQAEAVVQEYERASISLLQRRLKIGYSRAARLIDLLEERGVISKAEGGGRSREVLETRSSRYADEGHSMADEATAIMEEEKQLQEFLKKQAEREKLSHEARHSSSNDKE